MTTRKDFRTAWLLHLIAGGRSYGYELRRELEPHGLELDPALLYRTLRDMEGAGWIASRWVRSAAGPQRRVYDITTAGEAQLDRIAAAIEVSRTAHEAFLTAHRAQGRARPRRVDAAARRDVI